MRTPPTSSNASGEDLAGYGFALGCYVIWGFLPLYFMLVRHVPAEQLVAQRIVWSVVFAGLLLTVMRRLGDAAALLRDRAALARLTLSAAILAVNWLVFVWGVEHNRVLEVSFGYFINPLVSVALGTLLLGETLNRRQGLAVGMAALAIATQAWSLGTIPWISLVLAFSFGIYGFLRKRLPVGAASGLFVEALVLMPLALAYLAWQQGSGALVFAQSPATAVLVICSGLVTAGPLILFAAAVARLKLSTIGLLQYVAPSLQFLLAILIFNEPLEPLRLVGFVMIWISLAMFTRDALIRRGTAPGRFT